MAGSVYLRTATGLVCAVLGLLFYTVPASAVEDPAAPLYQPYAIDVIDLQLPPASIATLEAEPEDHYVEGTFSLAESDGTPGGVGPFTEPKPIGIRLKGGNGSFRKLKDEKAAFKIKFKEFGGEKFKGLKKLTLNNMVQDPSMLHETMAYEAFRALGVPAPRTGYANVYVNGVNYGLHLDVETYDDVSLPHWFASTQHLYEADKPGTDVRPDSQEEFEVDEGDEGPGNLTDLEALIAAADDEAGDWSDGMAGNADLDEMTRMWAVERYAGHWDGYAGVALSFVPPVRPNNYFLHSDESGLFGMLPWGTDQTWELDVEFDEPAGGLLFNNCLADASCKGQYVHALRELQGVVDGLDLGAQASCLAERLAPWQALEDGERREYDAEEIAKGVEAAEDFIAARPAELSDWLATQPSAGGEATAAVAPCGSPESEPAPEPETEAKADPGATANSGGSSRSAASSSADPPSAQPTPGESVESALRLLRLGAAGGQLQMRLRLGDSGRLTVRATMRTSAGVRRVCASHYEVKAPGGLTLRCSLSSLARERLQTHQLKLQVTVRFHPGAGKAETIRRTLVLPRLD